MKATGMRVGVGVSLDEARCVVEEYERSGLRRRAFAAGRGMSVHTLDGYRRRLKRAAAGADKAVGDRFNADGMRVSKYTSGSLEQYLRRPGGNLPVVDGNGSWVRDEVWALGRHIATVTPLDPVRSST